MSNSEYLAKRHAQWRIQDSELNALLQQCVGKSSVSFHQIVKGADNEVYSALMSSGDACIIRILRCDRDDVPGGVAEEAWCLQACSEAGVPVPEVLGVGTVRDDEWTYDAMVLSKLKGTPVSDLAPPTLPAGSETRLVSDGRRTVTNPQGQDRRVLSSQPGWKLGLS